MNILITTLNTQKIIALGLVVVLSPVAGTLTVLLMSIVCWFINDGIRGKTRYVIVGLMALVAVMICSIFSTVFSSIPFCVGFLATLTWVYGETPVVDGIEAIEACRPLENVSSMGSHYSELLAMNHMMQGCKQTEDAVKRMENKEIFNILT